MLWLRVVIERDQQSHLRARAQIMVRLSVSVLLCVALTHGPASLGGLGAAAKDVCPTLFREDALNVPDFQQGHD
jgi:hypothetical protein